jgi:hypothetical protein
VTSIATVIFAIALVVTSLAVVGLAVGARELSGRMDRLLDRLRADALPLLRQGQDVAENVNYITTSVREDVQRFKGTLHAAQTKLERAARTTEERIGEFNALLEVVQEEAVQIFLSTASTVRGVRAGAERLRAPRAGAWGEEEREEPAMPPFVEGAGH